MYKGIKLRVLQGEPAIKNIREARTPELFRGRPELDESKCKAGCSECADACPSNAITLNPLSIDLGRCTFCPACESACPQDVIKFTNDFRLASSSREKLIIKSGIKNIRPEAASKMIKKYFGRSLKLRSVSAAGCNGCELELNALGNVNFDMGRYGIDFVASPRHADGIVITGPISNEMAQPLLEAYEAVPEPKIVILSGSCAISGGIFEGSPSLNRSFLKDHKIDLYIPGCPPHPLTFISGLLDWLER